MKAFILGALALFSISACTRPEAPEYVPPQPKVEGAAEGTAEGNRPASPSPTP